MGYQGQATGCEQAVMPSIALERLATLEGKIVNLARKLQPVLTERPAGGKLADKPSENQLLTMISRQIDAVENLTASIDI